jgi:hypothetical protein
VETLWGPVGDYGSSPGRLVLSLWTPFLAVDEDMNTKRWEKREKEREGDEREEKRRETREKRREKERDAPNVYINMNSVCHPLTALLTRIFMFQVKKTSH